MGKNGWGGSRPSYRLNQVGSLNLRRSLSVYAMHLNWGAFLGNSGDKQLDMRQQHFLELGAGLIIHPATKQDNLYLKIHICACLYSYLLWKIRNISLTYYENFVFIINKYFNNIYFNIIFILQIYRRPRLLWGHFMLFVRTRLRDKFGRLRVKAALATGLSAANSIRSKDLRLAYRSPNIRRRLVVHKATVMVYLLRL